MGAVDKPKKLAQRYETLRGQEWAQARVDAGRNVSFPDSWPAEERGVSGAFVAQAMASASATRWTGALTFENALIGGPLEVQSVDIAVELCFRRCTFRDAVRFREASFAYRVRFIECTFESDLKFDACRGSELWFAAELELSEAIAVQPGSVFRGSTSFLDSKFSGNLDCDNARFQGEPGVSLNGTTVEGAVFMRSAEFNAGANFLGVRVGYSLHADRAKFLHATEPADFSESRIANSLSIADAAFHGPASFVNAQIGTTLACPRAQFLNPDAAISFNSIDVKGFGLFEEAVFSGHLDFIGAKINGALVMNKARFLHAGQAATFNSARIGEYALFGEAEFHGSFDFDAATIGSTADFSKLKVLHEGSAASFSALTIAKHGTFAGSVFSGPVNFLGARFLGDLEATAVEFRCASAPADFSSVAIDVHAAFARAKFYGGATFAFAKIGGPLNLESAEFVGTGPVNLEAMRLQNSVWLVGATFHGPVSFASSEIGGDLRCDKARFLSDATSFDGTSLKVKGHASLYEAEFGGTVMCSLLELDGKLFGERASFLNSDARIDFSFANIKGAVELTQARIQGTASFTAARIGGHANCNDIEFGAAVDFNSTHIGGWALLNRARFAKSVHMPYLRVGSSAEFQGAQFQENLVLSSANIGGSLLLSPAATGEETRNAAVAGDLDLSATEVKGNLRCGKLSCRGPARLTRMSVAGDAVFSGAEFHDSADFHSFAASGPAEFVATRFHRPAGFDYLSTAHSDFSNAWFADRVRFDYARIKGSLSLTEAEFMAPASFAQCVIEEDFVCAARRADTPSQPARVHFHQALNADSITVKGTFRLRHVRFAPAAELTLRLASIGIAIIEECELAEFAAFSAQISRGLLFNSNTVHGGASFAAVKVGGPASFNGTRFKKKCNMGEADFLGRAAFNAVRAEEGSESRPCAFDDNVHFEKTRFAGHVEFADTVFGGKANFSAAQFQGETRFGNWDDSEKPQLPDVRFARNANFDHAVFTAPAWFLSVRFDGLAVFSKTQFLNRVMFSGVDFIDTTDRSATFAEADFQSQVLFRDVRVEGWLTFYGAKSRHHLRIWTSCRFAGVVNFENASLALLEIEEDGDAPPVSDYSFLGTLTLTGCSYQRIKCPAKLGLEALWTTLRGNLVRREEFDNGLDFDREPYLRFEKFCRSVGESKLADTVYFDLRLREERGESRRLHRLWSAFERNAFGYGVLPGRMVGWFLAIWLVGAMVFGFPTSLQSAPNQIADGLRASFFNLVPGISEFMKADPRTATNTWLGIVAVSQSLAGWALLALLAHRFFKGLKR